MRTFEGFGLAFVGVMAQCDHRVSHSDISFHGPSVESMRI